MDKKTYMSIMAAFATAAVLGLLAWLVAPFVKALAWALIIGIATMPHHDRLARLLPRQPNLAAGVMVLVITLCIILPITVLIVMTAQNTAAWYHQSEQLVMALTKTLPETLASFPLGNKVMTWGSRFGLDVAGFAATIASNASKFLLDAATIAARNLADFVFTLLLSLFILFFVYRDGIKIVSAGIARFAANRERAMSYLRDIRSTVTAVTFGTILTCLVQGVLAGIGYYFADIPAPALCGALTAVAGLLPLVGTAFVWLPLAALIALNGAYLKAGLLSLWCIAVVVALADNAIRPLAIGAKSNISVPAVILGAVGGVSTMGLTGLIMGPILFAILATVWREATQTKPQKDGS